jgi:hypothetical protein
MAMRKQVVKKPKPKVPLQKSSSNGKISRSKNLIKRIREINAEQANMGGLNTVRGLARFNELLKERKELLSALKKEFPKKSLSEILARTKLENSLEKKLRLAEIKPLSEFRKIKRPSFSDAKKEFLEKNSMSEKSYRNIRKIYLGMAGGREMNHTQRTLFANELANKTNITFSKAMNFVNFAQRYPGMFKVRK